MFDPRDPIWEQSWAKKAVENSRYNSETQEPSVLLTACLWQEYGLLSLELAYKLEIKSGITDSPVKELFGVTKKY